MSNIICIYTDGSCNNKTKNNGGYGVILMWGGHIKEISGGQYIDSTSSRMEIRGVIEAMKAIKDKSKRLRIYCDNKYVCRSWELGWAERWEKENWEDRANKDLWKEFLFEVRKFAVGSVELIWIKGHNGNKWNDRADELARIGSKMKHKIKCKL